MRFSQMCPGRPETLIRIMQGFGYVACGSELPKLLQPLRMFGQYFARGIPPETSVTRRMNSSIGGKLIAPIAGAFPLNRSNLRPLGFGLR